MTQEQLDKLSIFQLRELARRMGVDSPTSKRKSELVENILDISNGNASPHFSKSKQGRPPKNAGFNFIEILMPNTSVQTRAPFVLSQGTYSNTELDEVEGFVELTDGLRGYVWQYKDYGFSCYFLPAKFISDFNLKMGDKIVGKVGFKDGQLMINAVVRINGAQAAKVEVRQDYNKIKHNMQTPTIENRKKLNLHHGANYYFTGDNNNFNTEKIIELLNLCDADIKIYINCSIAAKNEGYLDKLNSDVNLFTSRITDEEETAQKIVVLATEYAKRGLENGKKVIIAVDDIFGVMSVCPDDESVVNNLLSVTKNGENGGAISIFAVYKDDKYSKKFVKLADEILSLNNM